MTNKPNVMMPFGKHKGLPMTQVPVGYLSWMVNERSQLWREAQAELDRRGTVFPKIEISGHAIDRFSQRCLDVWAEKAKCGEGLYSFMARTAEEARKKGVCRRGRSTLFGVVWVFATGNEYPTLKTVFKEKKSEPESSLHTEVR